MDNEKPLPTGGGVRGHKTCKSLTEDGFSTMCNTITSCRRAVSAGFRLRVGAQVPEAPKG
jgi:hypothetical protein